MQGPIGANLAGKRLQLMKQAMPTFSRIGFLFNPKFSARNLEEVERSAATLGLVLRSSPVRLIEDVKPAISRLKSDGVEAMIVDAAPPLIAYQQETSDLRFAFQLPTVSEQPEFAEDGRPAFLRPQHLHRSAETSLFCRPNSQRAPNRPIYRWSSLPNLISISI